MKILVCLDGEPHTRGAIDHVISVGLSEQAEIFGLHVVDPWLRQFYSEIYAQGRREYLEWVDESLLAQALETGEAFDVLCNARGLEADFRIRHGEPLAGILEEIEELSPDLLVTGGKPLTAWGRFRSGNLPARLDAAIGARIPVVSILQTESQLRISGLENPHPENERPTPAM